MKTEPTPRPATEDLAAFERSAQPRQPLVPQSNPFLALLQRHRRQRRCRLQQGPGQSMEP
jgi:hypothetical protein